MRLLGNRLSVTDKAIRSAPDRSSLANVREKLLPFLFMPPLDELASAILLGLYVWQYTFGIAVRSIRGQKVVRDQRVFQAELKSIRAETKAAAKQYRETRRSEREQSRSPKVRLMQEDLAERNSALAGPKEETALRMAITAVVAAAEQSKTDGSRADSLDVLKADILGARDHLFDIGIDYQVQQALFGNRRLELLPENDMRVILNLLDTGFNEKSATIVGPVVLLDRQASLASGIIRAIVLKNYPEIVDNDKARDDFIHPKSHADFKTALVSMEDFQWDKVMEVALSDTAAARAHDRGHQAQPMAEIGM